MKPSNLLLLLFILLFALKVNSQPVISQQTSYNSGWYIGLSNYYDIIDDYTNYQEVGQTFLSLLTTSVSKIEFYISAFGYSGNVDLSIYSCTSQNSWGSLLNTKTDIPITASGWVSVDVSDLNLLVVAGNYYGFRLIPKSNLLAGIGVTTDVYSDGQGWASNGSGPGSFLSGNDYPFKILANTTLPVNLISFTAKKQNSNVLLQWSTASEQNAKDFIIEHSKDGNTWNMIGTVAATGQSNSLITYNFEHTQPVKGINYYRLLQRDTDGKSSTSKIIVVNFPDELSGITVLTNPVQNGRLQIQVNKETFAAIYAANGNLLWKSKLTPGLHDIDISSYIKGLYLLKANESSQKILVQ
jgi:hypothetical protein